MKRMRARVGVLPRGNIEGALAAMNEDELRALMRDMLLELDRHLRAP